MWLLWILTDILSQSVTSTLQRTISKKKRTISKKKKVTATLWHVLILTSAASIWTIYWPNSVVQIKAKDGSQSGRRSQNHTGWLKRIRLIWQGYELIVPDNERSLAHCRTRSGQMEALASNSELTKSIWLLILRGKFKRILLICIDWDEGITTATSS